MIINMTPHAIRETRTGAVYSPDGGVARVTVSYVETGRKVGGAPVSVATYGAVEGLPPPAAGTVYIVSGVNLCRPGARIPGQRFCSGAGIGGHQHPGLRGGHRRVDRGATSDRMARNLRGN